jgi:putative hemolysin
MGYLFYIVTAAAFLTLNAVFNGAETGLVTLDLDYLKFRSRSNQSNVWEKRLLRLASSPEKFLSVTLLGINSCLVIASSLITVVLQDFGPGFLNAGTLVTSVFIFFFCEFVPKMHFSARPIKYCLKFLPILVLAEFIFYIPVKIVTKVTRLTMKLLRISTDNRPGRISREELLILLSHGLSSGTLEENTSEMARGIIELRDITCKEIMIPRTRVLALEVNTPLCQARKTVIESGFSRVPVYDEEIDKVVGVLYFKDLFLKGNCIKSLADIMLEPLIVPEMKPAIELFRAMREKSVQVAIVVDEYATLSGIVTFEDLVEEIVGEIHDEYDKPNTAIKKNDDGSVTVRGDLNLLELNEIDGFLFASQSGASTINGLILEITGRIPFSGESLEIEGFKLKIVKSNERKIEWIKITKAQVS